MDKLDNNWREQLQKWIDANDLGDYSIPGSEDQLKQMSALSLSAKNLSNIPKEIENLVNLTDLWLGYNNLKHVPPELGKLINLTSLSLCKNQLTELPQEIINLNKLRILALDGNPLLLTDTQKQWLKMLKEDGCTIAIDKDVIDWDRIPDIKINNMGGNTINDNFLQIISNTYVERDDGEYSSLTILLTPMDKLNTEGRFTRALLYKMSNKEIILDTINDRFNENDNKTLEVYYENVYIGSVRKVFMNENIDNGFIVDNFCFDENKLKNIQIIWNGETFIIRQKSLKSQKAFEKEKTQLLNNIAAYDVYTLHFSFRREKEELRADKDVVLAAISKDGSLLAEVDEEFQNNRRIVLSAVISTGSALEYASKLLQDDKNIVLAAVTRTGFALQYASENLKNDKEIVLAAINQYSEAMKYVGKELQWDEEILRAKEAAERKQFIDKLKDLSNWDRSSAIVNMSEEMKNDKEIFSEAIRLDAKYFNSASDILKNDRNFILEMVKQNFSVVRFISDEMKNDEEIMNTVLKENKKILLANPHKINFDYINEKLKDDKEIIMATLNLEYGESLEKLSQKFRDDKEIALAAMKKKYSQLQYVSERLQDDKEVVLLAVSHLFGKELEYASERLKNDKDIVMTAISQFGGALKFVSEEMKNDKAVVLAAVEEFGLALQYASDELKNDKEVVLSAIYENKKALEYASKRLQNDNEIMVALYENEKKYIRKEIRLGHIAELKQVSEKLRNDKEFILSILQNDQYRNSGEILKFISKELKNDREIVLLSVKNDPRSFLDASDPLRSDKEIVLASLNGESYNSYDIYSGMGDNLKSDKIFVMEFLELAPYIFRHLDSKWKNDRDVVLVAVQNVGKNLLYANDLLRSDREVVLTAINQDTIAYQACVDDIQNSKIYWTGDKFSFREKPLNLLNMSDQEKFVYIKAGSFLMGKDCNENEYSGYDENEKPAHEVNINYDFQIGKYLITVAEFLEFVKETKNTNIYIKENLKTLLNNLDAPMGHVWWNDAKAYCDWRSKKENKVYRLPSEAEWEYVCRAGTISTWHFGEDYIKQREYSLTYEYDFIVDWENLWDKSYPVGSRKPNPWGIYDMYGNVSEWCEDVWQDNYINAPYDGSANKIGDSNIRVHRGGSIEQDATSSNRFSQDIEFSGFGHGFRVVLEI